MHKKQRGFSLVELLVAFAILVILALIAIPNLLRAQVSANEASAVGSVHAIDAAQSVFAFSYPSIGYAADLATLGPTQTTITSSNGNNGNGNGNNNGGDNGQGKDRGNHRGQDNGNSNNDNNSGTQTSTITTAGILDNVLGCAASAQLAAPCVKSGYYFVTIGSTTSYTTSARPISPGRTGTHGYYSDGSGVIRYSTDGAYATIADPPLH